MVLLKLNSKTPSFKLLNQDEREIDLQNYAGRTVVLYFYPKASTPGCTVQACSISESKKKLDKLNVVIFGISPDMPEKLSKFHKKEKLNFDLLSDPEHLIADIYGVWGKKKFMGKEYMGIHRTTFIIGEDGKLKHIMSNVKTKTHHIDLLSLVSAL
jgi:peroxiredoxin Q/BCP